MNKKLGIIHANEGLIAAYQSKIDFMLEEMQRSLTYWITAGYKANEPSTMATDASSAAILIVLMKRLMRRWNTKFADAASEMAAHYAKAQKDRTDKSMQAALRKAGFTVEFKVTPQMHDIITAATQESVSLIKSIASEHLTDVNEIVMRSVMKGRDLGGLQKELIERYDITKRRARLVARQSNNNVSSAVANARADELGITEAQWVHSNAGKIPRPEHVKWHGSMFSIKEGKYSHVSEKFVWPGTDFNCRCGTRFIVKTSNLAVRHANT